MRKLLLDDVCEVVKLRMTAYMSAGGGRTLDCRPERLDGFVPAVAKGTWRPGP